MSSEPPSPSTERLRFGFPEQAVIGGIIALISVWWTYAVGRKLYYAGDTMVTFDPAVLTYPILVVGVAALALFSLIIRSWLFAGFCTISLVICMAMWSYGSSILERGWENCISMHAVANSTAIRKVGKCYEIDSDNWSDLWSDDKLTLVPGFEWYSAQDIAAPNGSFRAFSVDGVSHVRVQKVKHGWRGIVLLNAPDDFNRLNTGGFLRYKMCKTTGWAIWSMQ